MKLSGKALLALLVLSISGSGFLFTLVLGDLSHPQGDSRFPKTVATVLPPHVLH